MNFEKEDLKKIGNEIGKSIANAVTDAIKMTIELSEAEKISTFLKEMEKTKPEMTVSELRTILEKVLENPKLIYPNVGNVKFESK